MSKSNYPILILGGGLSGLLTAYRLKQAGIAHVLLEARARLGGRIHTITTQSGVTIEMGATWFAEKHIHLMSLIRELDLEYEKQYAGNKVLYDFQNPARTIQEFELPPGSESSFIFADGSHNLINSLADRLDPKTIHLDEEVRSITFEKDHSVVNTNKSKFYACSIINTLPPNLFINTIDFSPSLPENLIALSKTTHTWMGESIKASLVYSQSPWRERSIGSMFSQLGPFTEIHDHVHKHNDHTDTSIIKGFLHPATHELTKEQREMKATEQLNLYFPNDNMSPLEYQDAIYHYHPVINFKGTSHCDRIN